MIGVLDERELSVGREARPVRLRLFCPLEGTIGALDGCINDIVDDDDIRQCLLVMLRRTKLIFAAKA